MDPAAPWIEPTGERVRSPRGAAPALAISLGGVPRGAVVVLCAAGALDREAAAVLNGLAQHGYESIAVDATAAGIESPDLAVDWVEAALDHLARRTWTAEQVGVVGYGAGGRVAMAAAARLTLGAAVSVAPTSESWPSRAGQPSRWWSDSVTTPWLGMFGNDVSDIAPSSLSALRDDLATASPVFTRVVQYPEVSGPFYRAAAAATSHAASFDSWQRTVEWLNLRVVPRPSALAVAWSKARDVAV
jgi:carboxymethylenebutenolidase